MNTHQSVSLQHLLDSKESIVDYFTNETVAPHFRARTGLLARFIPPEFTNWRDEQRAWRETAILFDQSHHMPELFLKGPDALKLLEHVGINSFRNFGPGKAKQYVGCTPRGHVIGDCILYALDDGRFELVSGMPLLNWVHYQALAGKYDVEIEREDTTPYNASGSRIAFRFQMDGPAAADIFREAIAGAPPELKFFNTTHVEIGGCRVLVLRHGMAGHAGVEISGPYEHMDRVRDALLKAGGPYGLKQGGTKSYYSTAFESGWLAHPLAGIYTSDELAPYRAWLPATSWEGNAQIAGSFRSPDIENYYSTPFGLGYDRIMKFDHDFIGREALEEMARRPQRAKRTLVWNRDDVLRIMASQFGDVLRYKSIELPTAYYGFNHYDDVRDGRGDHAGLSCRCGYTVNEGELLSLAMIDEAHAQVGTELTLTWGEPDGGSAKPNVERHEQTTIRVTVAPAPYAAQVRMMLRESIAR